MEKIKYIHKAFYNSAGGYLQASGYAKDNNMKLVTTEEEFCNNMRRYQENGNVPKYYMFTFETYV